MKDFLFIQDNEKNNRVLLPSCYYREDNTITGIYTTNSIRFYKQGLDAFKDGSAVNKNPNLTIIQKQDTLRYIRSSMADFDIKNNYICLKSSGTAQEKEYNLESGTIVVRNDIYMDIVEKEKIKEYLDNYGFDTTKEDEILNSINIILRRVPNKKLTYKLK